MSFANMRVQVYLPVCEGMSPNECECVRVWMCLSVYLQFYVPDCGLVCVT